MEFNQLIDEFAKRHNVENLVAVDDAAALDIDGIIVTIVAKGGVLNFSAEIGDPPVEGAAVFSNLLLEANVQSGAFFAKVPDPGQYVIVQRLQLALGPFGGKFAQNAPERTKPAHDRIHKILHEGAFGARRQHVGRGDMRRNPPCHDKGGLPASVLHLARCRLWPRSRS